MKINNQTLIVRIAKLGIIFSILMGFISMIPFFHFSHFERMTNPFLRNLNPLLFRIIEWISGTIFCASIAFICFFSVLWIRYFFRDKSIQKIGDLSKDKYIEFK